MSRTRVIRYETRPEAADANRKLVEEVFAQLNADDPGALRYATFQLADGVSFIHIAHYEDDSDPLSKVAAFAAFQNGIGERLVGPPIPAEAKLVGSYRFFAK